MAFIFREDRSNRSGDMADFRFSRWQPSSILDFQKLEFLTARTLLRAKMRHRAKLREDRLNRSGDMADFQFLKIAAVRHLGFVLRLWDHP